MLAAVDGRINNRGGLRADGAPAKTACACKHCMARCDCSIRRIPARGGEVCGYGCRFPWGGRKWDGDYQRDLERDARAVADWYARRIRVRRFSTELVQGRLGHLTDAASA